MRKNLFLAITMAVVIASCGNKNQQGNYENDVIDVNELSTTDKTKYGIVGAGTTMNQLQMINDNGDTLSVAISAAKEKQQMLGGLSQGDRIAVMIAEENGQKVATEVVNLNSLLGHWIMPNPMDGSDYVGMTIKEGGIAESINQSSTFYKHGGFSTANSSSSPTVTEVVISRRLTPSPYCRSVPTHSSYRVARINTNMLVRQICRR